jgi:hypothetical protein
MADSAPEATPAPEKEPHPASLSAPSAYVLGTLFVTVGIALALTMREVPERPVFTAATGAPSVGAEAFHTLVLTRGDITAAQQADNTPLSVQIKSVQPTDDQRFSYLVSYSGVEKGTFNLTDYLCTPNGKRLREPITPVQVDSFIPESAEYAVQNLPVPRHTAPLPYTALLCVSAAAWVGTGLWMFLPRRKRRQAAVTVVPPPATEGPRCLEDLLRPLVEKAAQKTITPAEKGRMEQILFQYWGALLELDHLNSVEQLRRILEHKEAGALLRTVEQWLYQPDSKIPAEEISQILKPYMDLPITSHPNATTEERLEEHAAPSELHS